jgi:peptidoglycan/xylan/chitin deacetylase (PgdA/CDA1 family)
VRALVALAASFALLGGSSGAAGAGEQAQSRAVPILMYHVLADAPAGAAYPELFVRPSEFAGDMRWLAAHGYHALTLDALWAAWHGRAVLPAHPIVITFDDGYRSDVGVALPVLEKHHWPGVLNLALHNLGARGLRPRGVRRLIAAGWEIDAHSLTHPDLTAVDGAQLEHEVAGSRREIHRLFHVPVDFFCYPAGRYDARVVAAVHRAGFLGATTTEYGLARPTGPYTLDRIRINGADGVSGFVSKLIALRPS